MGKQKEFTGQSGDFPGHAEKGISHVVCCHMEVSMEATEGSIYSFVCQLVCSGSQQIHEQAITRMRRIKRGKFSNDAILWSNGCYFWMEVSVDAESEPSSFLPTNVQL